MWAKVVEWLLGYLGKVIVFIFNNEDIKESFNTALKLAGPIVIDLRHKDSDGDEKRNLAFDKLKVELKRVGVILQDHLVNLAIEMAVAEIKVK